MIQKLLYLLGIKKQDVLVENNDDNSLSFIVSQTDPFIKITGTSDTDVVNFASMLYELHNGSYLNSVINLLLDMGKKDKNIALFTKKVLLEWGNLHKSNLLASASTNDNNEPIVKPTHFYKLSKNE